MALLALTPEGAKSLKVDGRHSDKEPWLRKQLADAGVPPDVHDFLKEVKQAGKITLNGCMDSAEVLGIRAADLIVEADGLIDSSRFIEDAVNKGIHCMYF
jgi:hypothetical protein